jgi:hypothetical protein
MFAGILSLLGFVSPIATKLADLYLARQKAITDIEREKIDAEIKHLEFMRDVQIADRTPLTSLARFMAAVGPISYFTKIFLWDKVIGAFYGCAGNNSLECRRLFSTDSLADPTLAWVATTVIGFYFLASLVRK